MGIFSWLLRRGDKASRNTSHDARPSKEGVGRNVDDGRHKTKTEKDLRRVQSQYEPKKNAFD